MRPLALLTVALLALSGCGGGGGGGGSASPANVSGTWDSFVSTNDSAATFQGCTGDASVLNGSTVADAFADCTVNPITVGQSGNTFSFSPAAYTCTDGVDTWTGQLNGGGTVSGPSLSGDYTMRDDATTDDETHEFTGSISGNAITLNVNHIEWTGSISGACNLSPAWNIITTRN